MMAWSYHFKHLFFQIQELVDANHTSKTELGVGTSASTHNNGSVNNPTVEITPGTPPTIHVNEKPLPEIKPEPIKEEEKKPVDGGGLSVPGIVCTLYFFTTTLTSQGTFSSFFLSNCEMFPESSVS